MIIRSAPPKGVPRSTVISQTPSDESDKHNKHKRNQSQPFTNLVRLEALKDNSFDDRFEEPTAPKAIRKGESVQESKDSVSVLVEELKSNLLMEKQNSDANSSYKVNLGWKKYLADEGVISDRVRFKNWNRDPFPGDLQVEKDLSRTRTEIPVMNKESVRKSLRDVAAFYCISNGVDYQQGLLELIAPFLLLKSKHFRTADCFAYFNSFMRNCFTSILSPKRT